jgi:bleomycin hydrolase
VVRSPAAGDSWAAAIQSSGLDKALTDQDILTWHKRPFTKELTNIGKIADQASSGDCWIYATLNAFKAQLISAGKVAPDFEFSKNYIYFYSVVEKVNAYFESLIAERVTSLSSRKFVRDFSLSDTTPEYLIADGGEHAWIRFLISKYGLVPEQAMPATKVTLDDGLLMTFIRRQVLVTAKELMNRMRSMGPILSAKDLALLRQVKLDGEAHTLSILRLTLGTPPDEKTPFQFALPPSAPQSYTPQSFLKDFVKIDPLDYVSIASTPMRPFGKTYRIVQHGSIGVLSEDAGSENSAFSLKYVNEEPARLAELVKTAIDAGQVIYFGNDVVIDASSAGVLDTRLYKVDAFLNPPTPSLSLKDQMRAGLVYSDHAMAFVGYELDASGQVVRFKVENSWGEKAGMSGYYSMARNWFDLFVEELAVHKSLVNAQERALWATPHPIPVATYDDFFGTE